MEDSTHSNSTRNESAESANARTNVYSNKSLLEWEDGDLYLGARNARMPVDKLTAQELAVFPDVSANDATLKIYLYLRNKMLHIWYFEPQIELTVRNVLDGVPSSCSTDVGLVKRIHAFLERYGYINYGFFRRLTPRTNCSESEKKRVIVIGAGIAGLAAARQLKYFGFNVVILEGRHRLGGRVSTFVKTVPPNKVPNEKTLFKAVELGASSIRGTIGNPLMTLVKQSDINVVAINLEKCPIFDSSGRQVERRRDHLVERAFNNILFASMYLAHIQGITEIDGRTLNLGDTMRILTQQMESKQQEKRLKFWSAYYETMEKIKKHLEAMVITKKAMAAYSNLLNELQAKEKQEDISEQEKAEIEIQVKCLSKDINDCIKQYDHYDARRKELSNLIAELRKNEPSEVYMNDCDKRLFDFHIANLEYILGTALQNCSLKHWNHSFAYELHGPHLFVPDGLSNLIGTLSAGTEVLRNSVVEKVEYGTQGVKVDYRHNDEIQSIFGDMCICTLPLGVLKDSIKNISGSPHFEPALPVNKRKAIEQLGFGTINKVILFFDRSFWDHQPVFGNIGESGWSRGELYMFQAVPDRSILVGLLSGEAANLSEDYEKRTIVIRAMNILIAVFGPSCPQKPIDAVVTNWRTDPFARGAVSYVPTEATGDLYDKLAEPVLVENEQPRILFAGEHTIRNYPASLHGAFLSGVREAARVADYFSGSPFTLTS